MYMIGSTMTPPNLDLTAQCHGGACSSSTGYRSWELYLAGLMHIRRRFSLRRPPLTLRSDAKMWAESAAAGQNGFQVAVGVNLR
jgi:hypothetical protein